MWFHKNSLADSEVFQGWTEFHCHLLPGVDDGIQKMDDTLAALRSYESLGIKCVWFTPHIMEDMPNATAALRSLFEKVKAAYDGHILLHLASENMLDNLFEDRLDAGDLLPIGTEGKHLLVETSYYNPPMDFNGVLQRICAKGYTPILAHPERYTYMERKDYDRLKEMGIMFQMNITSIAGFYGDKVKAKAERLLKGGYINLTGSDTHNLRAFSHNIEKKVISDGIMKQLKQIDESWLN